MVAGGFSKKSIFIISRGSAIRKCSSKQVLFKIGNIHRKTSVLESLFNKVASLWAYNFISTSYQKRLQYRCFPVKIGNTFFYRTPPVTAFVSLKKQLFNNDQPLPILSQSKTKNVGWLPLKRFVDLIILSYLPIISRNNSITLLLTTCRKQKPRFIM